MGQEDLDTDDVNDVLRHAEAPNLLQALLRDCSAVQQSAAIVCSAGRGSAFQAQNTAGSSLAVARQQPQG